MSESLRSPGTDAGTARRTRSAADALIDGTTPGRVHERSAATPEESARRTAEGDDAAFAVALLFERDRILPLLEAVYPSAYLELAVARALARCGGANGLDRLVDYLADVRAVLTSHARAELHAVLRVDHGFDQAAWREEITRFDGHITPFREHQRV